MYQAKILVEHTTIKVPCMGRTCITVLSGHSSCGTVFKFVHTKFKALYLLIEKILITIWTEEFVFVLVDCSRG